MLPQRSAVDRTIVSPRRSDSASGPVEDARSGSTRPQSDCAYGFESSRFNGTLTWSGSALYAYRSAKASFFASTTRCQYLGWAGPSVAKVLPAAQTGAQTSRMFIISTVAQVCAGGGS